MKNWRGWAAGLLVCAAAAWAVDWTAYKPQGYVSDFASVIDPASRSQLENYCAAVERATRAQMALVTVPSLEGEPIEDVANTNFRAWGVGRKGQERRHPAAAGHQRPAQPAGSGIRGWNRCCRIGLAGNILREMRPALRRRAIRRGPDGGGGNHRADDRQGQARQDRRHAAAAKRGRRRGDWLPVAGAGGRRAAASLAAVFRRAARVWRRGRRRESCRG